MPFFTNGLCILIDAQQMDKNDDVCVRERKSDRERAKKQEKAFREGNYTVVRIPLLFYFTTILKRVNQAFSVHSFTHSFNRMICGKQEKYQCNKSFCFYLFGGIIHCIY